MNSSSPLSRRAALSLGGATVLGVTTVGLAACSTGGGSGNAAANGPEFPKNTAVASLSDIPVGGTLSATVEGKPLLLAQPTEGKVVCFSAICTHQGCVVGSVQNGKIVCPCHNSEFSATDGSVTQGPAMTALAAKTVSRSGDTLTVS